MQRTIHALLVAAGLAAGAMGAAGGAAAQTPAFDPRAWRGAQAGPPTQVLTVGSTHLSQLPKGVRVDAALLASLLDRLAAYRPQMITAENVAGEQCEHLKRYAATYPDSYGAWCLDPEAAQKAVGLDTPQALAEIGKTLAAWPATPQPAERRRLAALFLAAGERPSAVVQWRRLPPDERHVGDGVTEETRKMLDRVGASANETYDIAVALAVRLGLERIYLVDDHTSDGALPNAGEAYGAAVSAAWKLAPSKAVAREQAMEAALKTPGDVLALYRFINRPDMLRDHDKADFGANLGERSAGRYGRQYVAGWEVRNLRMVANIRAVTAEHPGARALNIVGVAHKPYYDAYFELSPDVRLVDAEAVLASPPGASAR
ncbi:MAG: DUF5694 domain-containing protein [Phenylobacterium sp.]